MTAGNAGPVRFIVEESQLGPVRDEEIAARTQGGPLVRPGGPHHDPAPSGFAMSSARTGSWEAAHPRLAGFLGLLERLVAQVPTGGRAARAAPTTGPPLVGSQGKDAAR